MAPAPSPHETAAQNWARALHTYRAALRRYRAVLELQARRHGGLARPDLARPERSQPEPPRPTCAEVHTPLLERLSRREREVALLIAQGCTNRQIAEQLVVTYGTAANHVAHILDKLELANRTQVAAALLAEGGPPAAPQSGEAPPPRPIHDSQLSPFWLDTARTSAPRPSGPAHANGAQRRPAGAGRPAAPSREAEAARLVRTPA